MEAWQLCQSIYNNFVCGTDVGGGQFFGHLGGEEGDCEDARG